MLAVLTGADWRESGWGDLPVAGGLRRRDGTPAYRHSLPGAGAGPGALGRRLCRLCRRRDPRSGGRRGRADRRSSTSRCPQSSRREAALAAGRAARLGGLRRTISALCTRSATRRRSRPRSPRADRMSSGAASSSTGSPRRRWSRAARSATTTRPTAATRSTRPCSAPTPIAPTWPQIIGVPESRVRVVAGDIGGSFGMKSAIYNEVALVLLASKLRRPPGQMDQHPLGGVPRPTRRRATTSPRPSWRSTATAISSPSAPARSPRSAPMRSRTRTCL